MEFNSVCNHMSYKQIRMSANFGSMMTGRNERRQILGELILQLIINTTLSENLRKDKRLLNTYLCKGVDDFVSNFGFRDLLVKRIPFEESAEFEIKTAIAKNARDQHRLSEYRLLCLMLR